MMREAAYLLIVIMGIVFFVLGIAAASGAFMIDEPLREFTQFLEGCLDNEFTRQECFRIWESR